MHSWRKNVGMILKIMYFGYQYLVLKVIILNMSQNKINVLGIRDLHFWKYLITYLFHKDSKKVNSVFQSQTLSTLLNNKRIKKLGYIFTEKLKLVHWFMEKSIISCQIKRSLWYQLFIMLKIRQFHMLDQEKILKLEFLTFKLMT